LLSGLASRRRRHGALFIVTLAAGGLTPLLSHVEGRFLYAVHALSLLWAAGGWAWLDWRLAGWWGRRRWPLRLALGAVIGAALLHAGHEHVVNMRSDPEILTAQRLAATAVATAPPGGVLGIEPDLAYRAGRPFRMLPVGPPATVHAFARAQGATLIALEGRRDEQLRPHLPEMAMGEPPPGFTLLYSAPDPRGGRLRVYGLAPETLAPEIAP
jgi:hypothetical protein